MSQESIIEKIKKLLRMKRGGTAGEIDNALAMAAELARKHGIDLASVNPDDEAKSETVTHVEDVLKLRIPGEAKFAAGICVNFFNVGIIVRRPARFCWEKKKPNSIVFCGTPLDIEIARYVFVFLQRHFRQSWSDRTNRRLKNRQAFYHGMYLGLGCKLEAAKQAQAGVGLIHLSRALERRNEYLSRLFPHAKSKNINSDDSGAHAAKYAGIVEGQKQTSGRPWKSRRDRPERLCHRRAARCN
jgi:uncharacterized protein DUF2786